MAQFVNCTIATRSWTRLIGCGSEAGICRLCYSVQSFSRSVDELLLLSWFDLHKAWTVSVGHSGSVVVLWLIELSGEERVRTATVPKEQGCCPLPSNVRPPGTLLGGESLDTDGFLGGLVGRPKENLQTRHCHSSYFMFERQRHKMTTNEMQVQRHTKRPSCDLEGEEGDFKHSTATKTS